MAAKRSWRDGMQGAMSEMWSFHLSDEQRSRPPAKALPAWVSPLRPGDFVASLGNDNKHYARLAPRRRGLRMRNAAHAEY